MIRLGLPPTIKDFETKSRLINSWFKTTTDRLNVYSGSSDPVASMVPQGQWIVYHNTTLNETRMWVNWGGTLVKSAAFT